MVNHLNLSISLRMIGAAQLNSGLKHKPQRFLKMTHKFDIPIRCDGLGDAVKANHLSKEKIGPCGMHHWSFYKGENGSSSRICQQLLKQSQIVVECEGGQGQSPWTCLPRYAWEQEGKSRVQCFKSGLWLVDTLHIAARSEPHRV